MSLLSQFLGGGASGSSLAYSLNYMLTGSVFTAPYDCNVVIAGVGAGGGGAGGSYVLGGNSAPWAIKQVTIAAGQTLTMTIGAGGAAGTSAAGSPGGASSVALSGTGTILTIGGAEGGVYSASAVILTPATVVSTVTGADVWFPGLQAGATTSAVVARIGGAAVNLSGDGTGRSPGLSANGYTAGGSVGVSPVAAAIAAASPLPLTNFGIFGLVPSGTFLLGKGADGSSSPVPAAAPAFGGGGGNSGGVGGAGGYGAGGGAGQTTGGIGGSAYFSLTVSKA